MAKAAIEGATDQAEVDRILRNDIYKDDAAINEVEAFDLSSLLVNGFVSVKQGETLTDQEVLSKVNLPKDVEVIKVEKPTTSALGRLVAKVTLKLSDGSVEEINVPVEVVAPSTDHANTANDQSAQTPAVVPANNQSAQTTVVAPATTQAAANASQTASAQANARKAAKELPNTGTADSTVAMVAAAASALLGLGLAGRRRKEDEEA